MYHILASASRGSTVEARFLATLADAPPPQPRSTRPAPTTHNSESTVLPTYKTSQKWWTVSLEIVVTDVPPPAPSPYSPSPAPQPPLPRPPFGTVQSESIFDFLAINIGPGPAVAGAGPGSSSWVVETVLPGPRPKLADDSEDPSVLLNKRRASLESTAGQEPSMNDLKRFADSALRGTRVALHAGEQSAFARHLTTYLAGWGMDVSHVPLDSEESGTIGVETVWNKGRREPFGRFDSGFGGSGQAESGPSSPYASATGGDQDKGNGQGGPPANDTPSSLLIIDDDVTTLRRLLVAFKAPPLHYNPTLMSKRPQLANRRTRSSPHVRQLHQITPTAAGTVILHFASLTSYKQIKDIVQDAIANSRHPSLPEVLVIPKPAGPRRIITALWTSLKRPAVDPSLPPIATSPTSPGVQYWTPRLSPALAKEQQHEFDFASHDNNTSAGSAQSGSGSHHSGLAPKPRTPPAAGYYNHAGVPLGTSALPPSPLGKISDAEQSYFACVAEELAESGAGAGPTSSEGIVIQSPDGRAGIFFQPSGKSSRNASGKVRGDKAGSRPMERENELAEDPLAEEDARVSSPGEQLKGSRHARSSSGSGGGGGAGAGTGSGASQVSSTVTRSATISAPHQLGLGQHRRGSGSASSPGEVQSPSGSSASASSPLNVPLSTPALTLDSFISAAKSRQLGENPDAPAGTIHEEGPTGGGATSRRPSGSGSPRAAFTSPFGSRRSNVGSPAQQASPQMQAQATSPAVGPHISAAQAAAALAKQREVAAQQASAQAGGPGANRRTASGASGKKQRRTISRRATLATVPPINVLIVEDNPINQTILSMFMKKKGIKYAVAKDGEEAVQKWKAGSFHLVLMDIQLPVKDGIEATREIREMERINNIGTLITTPTSDATSPNSPVTPATSHSFSTPGTPLLLSMPVIIVALTASSLQADRVAALAAGCNDFLTKPVSLPWLQQKLLEWGSMAYLSGFSRDSPDSDRPASGGARLAPGRPSKGLTNEFNNTANRIAGQLHIDPRGPHSRSASPAGSDASAGGGPGARTARSGSPMGRTKMAQATLPVSPLGAANPGADPHNPVFNITSPTPDQTPHGAQGSGPGSSGDGGSVATILGQEPSAGPVEEELEAIDKRLDSLHHDQEKEQSHAQAQRPGPTPLTATALVSEPELEPSLQSVLADGQRLLDAGRVRANSSAADSFRLVMQESGSLQANAASGGVSPAGGVTPRGPPLPRRTSSAGSASSARSSSSVRQSSPLAAGASQYDSSPESSSPDSLGAM